MASMVEAKFSASSIGMFRSRTRRLCSDSSWIRVVRLHGIARFIVVPSSFTFEFIVLYFLLLPLGSGFRLFFGFPPPDFPKH